MVLYNTTIKAFYVEYANYANSASNEKKREIKLIPEVKTKANYCIALEQAVYELITGGNADYIIALLEDAKVHSKLPSKFCSLRNEFDLGFGRKVALRCKIENKRVTIQGDNIRISNLAEEIPIRYKNNAIFLKRIVVMRQTIMQLQKLYD